MNTAKSDIELVLDVVLPMAEEMLVKHGEFFPFGGAMQPDGEILHVNTWDGDEHPASNDVIATLTGAFKSGAERGDYRATAIVYDIVTVPPGETVKQDAIAVALDHRNDYSVVVVYPYSFDSNNQLAIHSPFASKGGGEIFGSTAG